MKHFWKKLIRTIKKLPLGLIGCLLFIAICAVSLGVISTNTSASKGASLLSAKFSGQYKIEDGDWKPIPEDGHISTTSGDVTLRGKFIFTTPDGEVYTDNVSGYTLNFYCNHISVGIRLGEGKVLFDAENPHIGVDACGALWSAFTFPEMADGVVEIVISNPHDHGNELAIDQFLENVRTETPTLLGKTLKKDYDAYRYIGFAFVAIGLGVFILTFVAFFAKLRIAHLLWVIGFWAFFTGGFYILDVVDVFLWNEHAPFNTTALCFCQILSHFFLGVFATCCLSGKKKKISSALQIGLGATTITFAVLAARKVVRIFDIVFYWHIVYAVIVAILFVFCIQEMRSIRKGVRVVLVSSLVSMLCVLVDYFGARFALWGGLYLSKSVFIGMLVVAILFGIYTIILNYKMSIRTKEMETELKNKSIAVMISQIQPHFLYNSLNSIAELCVVDPKRAEKATIDFSRYLRGNMGALNERKTIEFEDELHHLSHYIELEKLRYGDDLQFEYDIRATDFTLPALTVQPLVENAVNHGIRYHKAKGKVKISSFSDEDNDYVTIEDDGVGFDPAAPMSDGRKHIGIENVKYRLDVMCGGSVDIKSEKDKGTLVTIRIPKEK